jgi:hypothetical protein
VADGEMRQYVCSGIAREFGLSEPQARRLRGGTLAELRADAQAMRAELGLEPLDERGGAARDERGRFAGSSNKAFNEAIRAVSGR